MLLTQGKQLEAAKVKEEMQGIHDSLGISIWKNFLPMIQIPLGFGCFRVVRGMTSLPVPALADEQLAWITDLTTYDPLFVLPIAASAFTYWTFKVCWTQYKLLTMTANKTVYRKRQRVE